MAKILHPARPIHRGLAAPSEHWSHLKLSLLWIYRGKVPPTASGYMDTFPSMTAWLVLSGEASVKAGKQKCTARTGEWLFPKPVARHQNFSRDAEILSVRFRIEWPNGDHLFNEGLNLALKAEKYPELRHSANRLLREVEKITKTRFEDASFADKDLDFPQFIRLEKNVLAWCSTVYWALTKAGLKPNLHQPGDPRLHAILRQLDDWPLQEAFRVGPLARRTGVSRSHLDRIVAKALGSSSKDYIDRRRLDHALRCLKNPDIPVKQITVETGFQHSSSFCAWFKIKTGRYPGEMKHRLC